MKSAALIVAVVAVGFGVDLPAKADTGWAAVAYSRHTGRSGWRSGATQADTEQAAIAACGQPDCDIIASGPNCVSFAFDHSGHIHGVTGDTEQAVLTEMFIRYRATDQIVRCSWNPN